MKLCLLTEEDFFLDILVKIYRNKAFEFSNYLLDFGLHHLDYGSGLLRSSLLILVRHARKLIRPIGGQGVLLERCGQLLLEFSVSDMSLRAWPNFFSTAIVDIVVFVAVLLFFRLILGGNACTALATAKESTERLWLILGLLMGSAAVFKDYLYAVKQLLWDNGFMLSLVNLSGVTE